MTTRESGESSRFPSIARDFTPHIEEHRTSVDSTSIHPPRRPEPVARSTSPKLADRQPLLKIPTLQSTPEYEPVTEWRSLQLYRLCPAVPYLLGSVSIVARIQMVIENNLDKTEKLPAQFDGYPTEEMSGRSGALLAIFISLQKSEQERLDKGDWTAQGLVADGAALRLYKDRRPQSPESCSVDLDSFVEMAKLWQKLPNPANVCCDDPAAKHSWSHIVAKLREVNVDFTKIDRDMYKQLTTCEPESLEAGLRRVKAWSDSGFLQRRYDEWKSNEAMSSSSSSSATSIAGHAQTSLYSKRFSHAHPRGISAAELLDLEKAERRQNRQNQRHPAEKDQQAAEKKTNTFEARWMKFSRKFNIVTRMSLIMLVFFALIGVAVWGMTSANTSNFTPSGGR